MRSPVTFCVLSLLCRLAVAEEFGGVEFPHGIRSFADRAVLYEPGAGASEACDDPQAALGAPDFLSGRCELSTSLGASGTLIVEFTDNALVDQDFIEGGLDLFIFEAGTVEEFRVSISRDGTEWIEIGVVRGQPTGLDIEPYAMPGDYFRFVRMVDVKGGGQSPARGADIDAVGAIGSVPIFKRGDTNVDVQVNIADAICILDYLFGEATAPCKQSVGKCEDGADSNDDGRIDIGDAIRILNYLFEEGATLPHPFGACGPDPTGDDPLGCVSYPPCD